jgi:hypothetical protein
MQRSPGRAFILLTAKEQKQESVPLMLAALRPGPFGFPRLIKILLALRNSLRSNSPRDNSSNILINLGHSFFMRILKKGYYDRLN